MRRSLINTKQAAEILGVATATLTFWRSTGSQEVPFKKIGGRVLYRVEDLDKWLDKRTYHHTGEYPSN
jgi:DNA-binding transcriptional MerR regulator